jgi:hypothetical protein
MNIVLTTQTSAVEFAIVIHKDVIAKTCKSEKQVIELFMGKKNCQAESLCK